MRNSIFDVAWRSSRRTAVLVFDWLGTKSEMRKSICFFTSSFTEKKKVGSPSSVLLSRGVSLFFTGLSGASSLSGVSEI